VPSSPTASGSTEAQIRKEIAALQEQGKTYESLVRQLAEKKARQQEVTQAIQAQTREFQNQKNVAGTYKAMNAELGKLRDQYRNLTEADRKGPVGANILKRTQELDRELKNIDKSMGQYYRNVGNYESALRGLGSALGAGFLAGGAVGVLTSLVGQMGQAIQVTADFNRQINFLGAVSRASAEDMAAMEAQARHLGETTQFTSSQVAQLQIEYAKLGFGPAEILAATADTLNAAIVAQTDLGETAAIVGSVIRQFGFDASETSRVTDVMALGFSSSALDMQKFSTSMKTVGPISASLGYSLEQTVGMLGVLSDAGLDASMTGAGLKNVLLDLEVKGHTLSEALAMISGATDPAVKAFELFGKRGAVIGTVLAQNQDKVESLSNALVEGAGFAEEAAAKISDDLKGSQLALGSALEATQLAWTGLYQNALRAGIDALTVLVRTINTVLNSFKALGPFIYENRELFYALGVAVLAFNASAIMASANALRLAAAQRLQAISSAAAATAQWVLNAAMTANPVGIVITAFALLVGFLVKLYRSNEDVRAGVQALTKRFMEWYDSLGILKLGIFGIVETIKFLVTVIKEGPRKAFEGLKQSVYEAINSIQVGFNELVIKAKIAGVKLKSALTFGFADTSDEIAKLEAAIVSNREAGAKKVVAIAKDTAEKVQAIDEKAAAKAEEVERRRADLTKKKVKERFDFEKLSIEQLRELAASDDDLLSRKAKKELDAREKSAKASQKAQEQAAATAKKIAEDRLKASVKIAEMETALIVNEYVRREQELRNRAAVDSSALVGDPEQIEAQSLLIQNILTRDLAALNDERRKAHEAALALAEEYSDKLADAQIKAGKKEVDAALESALRMNAHREKQASFAFLAEQKLLQDQFAGRKISADELEFNLTKLQQRADSERLEAERLAGEQRIALRMAQVGQEIEVLNIGFQQQLASSLDYQNAQEAALLEQLGGGNLEESEYAQALASLDALVAQQRLDAEAQYLQSRAELVESASLESLEFQLSMMDKENTAQEEKNKEILGFEKERRKVQEGFEAALGESIGEFLLSQEKDLLGFMKSVSLAALDALESTINIAIAEATARALASADSIATFGATGLAKAALLAGLIKGAFAVVKSTISRMEEGGTISPSGVWEGSAVPVNGGLVSGGKRHAQGGIKGVVGGQAVEIESGEYVLRNGAMTHIINRSSSRRFLPALNTLKRMAPPSVTLPGRAFAAMQINRLDRGGTLAVSPLAAPVNPGRALASAGAEGAADTPLQIEALVSSVIMLIAEVNQRIDRIQVVNDPAETLIHGGRVLKTRNASAQ